MSDTPVVGKIEFSSVANPNTWDIGESKCLVFASPSEAKRAEELFSAMQRELTAALAKLSKVEAERDALRERVVVLQKRLQYVPPSISSSNGIEFTALDAARKK